MQPLVGLLVALEVGDEESELARHDFQKMHLFFRKVARLRALHADHALKLVTAHVAVVARKQDDRDADHRAKALLLQTRVDVKAVIAADVRHHDWAPLLAGQPADALA